VSTKAKVVVTPFGPIAEKTRLWIVNNLKADPEKRKAVLELLCKQMGSVAKGELEMQLRYPELFEEDEHNQ
jgi:hypothetical protein